MIRQLLLTLAAVILVSAGPANWPVKATCNDNNPSIVPCVQAFFGQFGFTGSFPNFTQFLDAAVTLQETQDLAGWAKLQTWMNTFITCVGGHDNFDACVDWHYLMPTCHMSQREAQLFNQQLLVFEYEVNPPAYDIITHNWFCIKGVNQHEGAVVDGCRQHFEDQQHQNPNMTCQHVGEFLNCIERPYAINCGRDVGQVKCHEARIIYNVAFAECASSVALHCGGGGGTSPPPPPAKYRWIKK